MTDNKLEKVHAELVAAPDAAAPLASVALEGLAAHVKTIQSVMRGVMRKGHHYGTISGCGPKPTLLKPGAEVVCMTFQIALAALEVEDLSTADAVRYRVKAIGMTPDGIVRGVGIGEASSDEAKYKWRRVVSDEEWAATPENRRRVKYAKNSRYNQRQIRTEPADVANTCLKMAKKRAFVDLTLTACAASDVFSQDLEDLDPEIADARAPERPPEQRSQRPGPSAPPAPAAPQAPSQAPERGSDEPPHPAEAADRQPGPGARAAERAAAAAASQGRQTVGVVSRISERSGEGARGPWSRVGALVGDEWHGTFDERLGRLLMDAERSGEQIVIVWKADGDYRTVVDVIMAGEQPAPPDGGPVGEDEIPF